MPALMGCPASTPLVVCDSPSSSHTSDDNIVNPAFATFVKLFSAPPLLTP